MHKEKYCYISYLETIGPEGVECFFLPQMHTWKMLSNWTNEIKGLIFFFFHLNLCIFVIQLCFSFLSSSLTLCILIAFGLKSLEEFESRYIGGGIFYLFWITAWHITKFKFTKIVTKILLVWWFFYLSPWDIGVILWLCMIGLCYDTLQSPIVWRSCIP
jgi:hypothetical protein